MRQSSELYVLRAAEVVHRRAEIEIHLRAAPIAWL